MAVYRATLPSMKARIIYTSGLIFLYGRDNGALIAKNGKSITIHGRKARIGTDVWGVWSPELAAEARSINDASKAIDARKRALNARLRATQPDALAAAALAPLDTPPVYAKVENLKV